MHTQAALESASDGEVLVQFDRPLRSARDLAFGPGIAAQYVDGNRYIGGVGFVAPAYSRSKLSGQNSREGFATFLNIRGSLGFNDGLRAWGLSGNKSLLTIDRRDISMTDSVSSIELFYLASY